MLLKQYYRWLPLAWFGIRSRRMWGKIARIAMMIFIVLKIWIVIRNIIHPKPDMEEVLGRSTILDFKKSSYIKISLT